MTKRIPLLSLLALVLGLVVACGSTDDKLKVTGFDKKELETAGGTYVRVSGNGFTQKAHTAKVWFGGQPGTVIRFESDTEMIVQAPGGKAGDTADVLFVFEPGGEIKIPKAFTFVEKATTGPSVNDLDTSKTK